MLTKEERKEIAERLSSVTELGDRAFYEAITGEQRPDTTSYEEDLKATESLIYSVVLLAVALLIIVIFFVAILPNRSMDTVDKAFAGFLFMTLLLFVIIPGILCLTGYINWSNAPQGMFLREIIEPIK